MAQARGLNPDTPPDLAALAEFCEQVTWDKQAPLAGRSVGQTLRELLDALADLGADASTRCYLAVNAAWSLFQDLEPAQASAVIEPVLSLANLAPELVSTLRLERARGLISRQQLAPAVADLDATREGIARSPAVLRALERGETPSDADRFQLTEAVYWFAARAECEISLGRPSRAEGALASAERLAKFVGEFDTRWLVFDLRLRQALALGTWEEVEPLVAGAEGAGLLAELRAADRAKLDLSRAIARHELRQREAPGDATELATIQALSLDERAPTDRRSTAARFVAAYAAELGDAQSAREALARVGGPADSALRSSFEAADLDAIALRIALLDGDRAAKSSALERLERSARRFLDDWAEMAELSSAVAVLQFAQRERVLSHLIEGCLVVHGPDAGARLALEWLHRAQLIGGLARGLGLDRAGGSLERDLAWILGPRRGLVVFHSGRRESRMFLVDEGALRCLPVAGGQRLREAARALSNSATRAVRAGAESDAASVREELDSLGELIGARELMAWLGELDGVTIVGDESVGHLPLALLETASGERLGARVALVHAPSIPVAAELARRADDSERVGFADFRACLLGAPAAPADVGIDANRMQAWAERLGGRARLHVGREAVPAALRELAGDCQLLQVVAHGRYDLERECRAGFLLFGDPASAGEVWFDTIEQIAAPRLAALAVCGASQRPVLLGDDGRTGLAASFLLAGSHCVLQTPIDLEVHAAVDLFERASVLIGAGASPAEALRDARRASADRAPKLQDFLIHAWGAGHAAVVDAASVPASARAALDAQHDPRNAASQAGNSNLARVALALVALLALLGVWRVARRRVGQPLA